MWTRKLGFKDWILRDVLKFNSCNESILFEQYYDPCECILNLGLHFVILQRRTTADKMDDKQDVDAAKLSNADLKELNEKEDAQSSTSLVFGYLNLFSDGVVCVSFLNILSGWCRFFLTILIWF